MLNIYYPICCGIDVHKKMLVATIATTNEQKVTTYQTKKFSTLTKDINNLEQWLKDNNCKDVCMESTGKYWIPIFNILEKSCKVVITHPKYVRAIPGKKTDTKDSIWIADIFKHGLVNSSFMPPADIRQLRDLMRYRFKLLNCRTSEKNRFQNSLTMSNIMISNVVTDTFGKTAQSILKKLLDKNDNLTLEEISPLLRKNLKASPQEILDSVQGNLTKEQNSKMEICLKHYDNINVCVEKLEEAILPLIAKYQQEIRSSLNCSTVCKIFLLYTYFLRLELICLFLRVQIIFALGLDLLLKTMKVLVKRNPLKFLVQVYILSLYLFNVLTMLLKINLVNILNLDMKLSKNVVVTSVQLLQLLECYLLVFTICC